MTQNDDNNGIGLDDLGSAVTDEGSSSSSGSGGGGHSGNVRTTIIVKSHYGTEQVPPDTECEKCPNRAVGVLVLGQMMGNKRTKKTRPLCSRHRDEFKRGVGDVWEEYDFRRFVD